MRVLQKFFFLYVCPCGPKYILNKSEKNSLVMICKESAPYGSKSTKSKAPGKLYLLFWRYINRLLTYFIFPCLFFLTICDLTYLLFSARCMLMLRCQCPSVCLSVHLSVTEVHWRIVDNLGFKFLSKFTAHCGRREG